MTTKQYIILAIIGAVTLILVYAMSFLAMCLIFDGDVQDPADDCEECRCEYAYYEWRDKHGSILI